MLSIQAAFYLDGLSANKKLLECPAPLLPPPPRRPLIKRRNVLGILYSGVYRAFRKYRHTICPLRAIQYCDDSYHVLFLEMMSVDLMPSQVSEVIHG